MPFDLSRAIAAPLLLQVFYGISPGHHSNWTTIYCIAGLWGFCRTILSGTRPCSRHRVRGRQVFHRGHGSRQDIRGRYDEEQVGENRILGCPAPQRHFSAEAEVRHRRRLRGSKAPSRRSRGRWLSWASSRAMPHRPFPRDYSEIPIERFSWGVASQYPYRSATSSR